MYPLPVLVALHRKDVDSRPMLGVPRLIGVYKLSPRVMLLFSPKNIIHPFPQREIRGLQYPLLCSLLVP
jgi:hypothetical protein